MAWVRILVDGYSFLHSSADLIANRAPHSSGARDFVVGYLTQYQDALGIPVSVFFDGVGKARSSELPGPKSAIEILYSKDGQTADDMIERAACRLLDYGEVLVVTDDLAERRTVLSLGAVAWSCEMFRREVDQTLASAADDVERYNQSEWKRFKRKK